MDPCSTLKKTGKYKIRIYIFALSNFFVEVIYILHSIECPPLGKRRAWLKKDMALI